MRFCASAISGNSGVRRKAFKRRCEHEMRVGGTSVRLIKLRQRERRTQLEASRLLLLRDSDGREEGFLDRCGVQLDRA